MKEELLRRKSFELISWAGCAIATVVILINFFRGMPDIAIDTGVLFLGLLTNLFIFYHSRNVTLHTLIGIILFLIYILSTAQSLGGQIYFWIYVLPWIAFFLLGLNIGTLIILFCLICFAGFMYYIPPKFLKVNAEVDIIFSFLLVSVTIFAYEILKIRYEREIEYLSRIDILTNLWNRRKFYELFDIEVARSKRYKRSFALVLIDIDQFKKVNDSFGHTIADQVLQEMATLFKKNIRATDYLFRWGGEEFLILAQEVKAAPDAHILAEKLRVLIEQTTFPTVGKLTISVSITEFNLTDTLDTLMKKLDEGLYKAKSSGRNRIEVIS